MLRQVNTSTWNIADKQQLENNLKDRNWRGDGDEKILVVFVGVQSSGNHAEYGVQEQAKCWDTEQDVVEVALLFAAEFQVCYTGKMKKSLSVWFLKFVWVWTSSFVKFKIQTWQLQTSI